MYARVCVCVSRFIFMSYLDHECVRSWSRSSKCFYFYFWIDLSVFVRMVAGTFSFTHFVRYLSTSLCIRCTQMHTRTDTLTYIYVYICIYIYIYIDAIIVQQSMHQLQQSCNRAPTAELWASQHTARERRYNSESLTRATCNRAVALSLLLHLSRDSIRLESVATYFPTSKSLSHY